MKKTTNYPTVDPIVRPRKELLPPIHERSNQIYMHIHRGGSGKNIVGIDNGWINDIFQSWCEVVKSFNTFRNCSNKISEFGTCYDRDVVTNDYVPAIAQGIRDGFILPGFSSPGDLNQYMASMTTIKEYLIMACFAKGERPINLLEEEYYKNKFAEELLENYKPDEEFEDNKAKVRDASETVKAELLAFMHQFEVDMNYYTDYDVISKYNRDQALVYMMIRGIEFKQILRDYETYCKVIAVCEARYEELLTSRFNKELESMKKYKKYENLISEEDFLNAMLLNFERDLKNPNSKHTTYNPKYYIEFKRGNALRVPRNFAFLKNIFDISLMKEILKRWDSYTIKYLNFNWNEDSWVLVNGIDRILNEDNVRYINEEIVPNPIKNTSPYDYTEIRNIDPNESVGRMKKRKPLNQTNVVNLTTAQYKFLNN